MLPAPFAYGETAAPAFLYRHAPFLFLGFLFQFIARHLLHTLNVIVVGSFTTPHHYCPMCVQPSLVCKRTIITRAEQSYGRVPFAGLCRLFISVYVPGAGLPGARASAFPAPHGSEICPDRAAYSAPAIDTHKAQCRWPWPFPPANTQWHWIRRP